MKANNSLTHSDYGKYTVNRILVAAIVVCILCAFDRLSISTIAHDDWPFINEDNNYHFFGKTLHEGRLINYYWAALSSVVTTPQSSIIIYWISWLATTIAWSLIEQRKRFIDLLITVLIPILSWPIIAESMWPNTMVVCMASTAITALYLTKTTSSFRRHIALFISVFVAYQTYPVMAFIALMIAALPIGKNNIRSVLLLCAVFMASSGASTIVSMTYNHVNHGVFGIPMDTWREPNYIQGIPDFIQNLKKTAYYSVSAIRANIMLFSLIIFGLTYYFIYSRRVFITLT